MEPFEFIYLNKGAANLAETHATPLLGTAKKCFLRDDWEFFFFKRWKYFFNRFIKSFSAKELPKNVLFPFYEQPLFKFIIFILKFTKHSCVHKFFYYFEAKMKWNAKSQWRRFSDVPNNKASLCLHHWPTHFCRNLL